MASSLQNCDLCNLSLSLSLHYDFCNYARSGENWSCLSRTHSGKAYTSNEASSTQHIHLMENSFADLILLRLDAYHSLENRQ